MLKIIIFKALQIIILKAMQIAGWIIVLRRIIKNYLQAERKKEKAEAARQANIERIFAEGEGAGDDLE